MTALHDTLTVALDDVTDDLAPQVGGKAIGLARLRRAGLPVPDGFCLTTGACRDHLRTSGTLAFIEARTVRARFPATTSMPYSKIWMAAFG